MNAVLPNSDWTGVLGMTEVYDFFDGPKLFVCENRVGQRFLGYWTGSNETSDSYWLVPISKERHLAVRSGGVSLHDAITKPELGYILECGVRFADGQTDARRRTVGDLDERLIPDKDEFLALRTETLPVRMASLDLPNKAVAIRREILGLHFNFPGTREDAPTKTLGKLLVSLQDLIDAIGQSVYGVATMRGTISPDILARTETRLIEAAGASFGVEICAAENVDLFDDSLISECVEGLTEILEIGDHVEPLREKLLALKPRAASKYRVFLASLLASQSTFRLDWASPSPSRNRSVGLDLRTAAAALKTAEEVTSEVGETRTAIGHFVGVELPRKAFTLVLEGDDEIYRGRISQAAMAEAEHVTLNHGYRITVRETLEVTASGEERSKFEVERIEGI